MHFSNINKQKITFKYKIIFVLVCVFFITVQFNFVGASENGFEEINNKNVIDLVNLERGRRGIEELKENEILNKVAQSKLNDMLEDDYFAHTSLKGVDPWKWFFQAGYRFEYAGENLAKNFITAKSQHQAWMDSPAHKRNILNNKFTNIGVAVGKKYSGDDIFVTVQVFGTPEEIVIISPNFTPQTFEVSEELLYKNVDKGKIEMNMGDNFFSAGLLDNEDVEEKTILQFFAWFILIVLTILIIAFEFKFFLKKYKS